MIAFEIHTYREGQWRIDSIFDDAELAVETARRIDEGRRYAGVLVIAEDYDEATNTATNRTLFRGGRFANRVWRVLPAVRRRARQPGPQARKRARERLPGGEPRVVVAGPGPIGMVLSLMMIVLGGLAAVVGLRSLAALLLG
jgi:hypothetical protein